MTSHDDGRGFLEADGPPWIAVLCDVGLVRAQASCPLQETVHGCFVVLAERAEVSRQVNHAAQRLDVVDDLFFGSCDIG